MIDTPIIPSNLSGKETLSSGDKNIVLKIPEGITKLPEGSLVDALVIRKYTNTSSLLRLQNTGIEKGELTVNTKIPLAQGSKLVLKVISNTLNTSNNPQQNSSTNQTQNQAPVFRAQIISVNGEAPVPPATNSATPKTQTVTPQGYDIVKAVLPENNSNRPTSNNASNPLPTDSSKPTKAAIVNLSRGTSIDGIILKPSTDNAKFLPQLKNNPQQNSPNNTSQGSSSATPQNLLKPSDNITLKVISSNIVTEQKPQTSEQTKNTSLPNNNQSKTQPSNKTVNNQAPQTTKENKVSPQQNVQNNQVKTNNAATENITTKATRQTTPTPTSTPNPTLSATVIGQEKSGETVLKTPIGTIITKSNIGLPKGSTLDLEVTKVNSRDITSKINPTEIQNTTSLKQKLTAHNSVFQEILSTLKAIESATGIPIIQKTIPQSNITGAEKQLAARLLWFIATITNGDAAKWLGAEATKMLNQAGKKELLSKLDLTFKSLRATFSEPNSGGWNTLLFPVYDGSKMQHGLLYIRPDDGKKKNGATKGDVRFIIEVALEDLGELQFDGLVKNTHSTADLSKKFDLFIRTKKELTGEMQKDILDIFVESLEISNIKGTLVFQAVEDFPINPIDDNNSHENSEIIA